MRRLGVDRINMLLLWVVLVAAWVPSLTLRAQGQQGADVNARSNSTRPANPQSSNAGAQQQSSPAASTIASGAEPGTGQLPAKQPEEKRETTKQKGDTQESEPLLTFRNPAVYIALAMILVLGLLFFLQFSYSHRLDQTTYLGEVFRDSVFNFEYGRLKAEHIDKWNRGIYRQEVAINDPPKPLDPHLQDLDDKWGDSELQHLRDRLINESLALNPWGVGGGTANPYETDNRFETSTALPGLPPRSEVLSDQDKTERTDYQEKAKDFKRNLQDWKWNITKNAHAAYEGDLKKDREMASEHTEKAIDTTEASLLRGQGPQFILEFTALIVIIFLAVVLGVLGVLRNEQIGTLLAAIAGYVLGKATVGRGGTGEVKPTGKE